MFTQAHDETGDLYRTAQSIALSGIALPELIVLAHSIASLERNTLRGIQPEIALAKQEFGWQPKIALDAGLGKTIDYFERLLA